ncbi:MAG: bifunctional (p)ppGpp synthetase/guanosine-3',5'-bis(diphosphate) 3'-pyrophosphohydrolase [Spirochaetes bacterium]|nr:bifunctional (p)ppGpp synthetase/guanosine-3',5'-bis(diphosphate) 3'-pyrophosphohydrolase [Spirochaetota bacterium]
MPELNEINKPDYLKLKNIISLNYPGADISLIEAAYRYADNAHKDQIRLSGEPYIMHPIEVACILAGLKLDFISITAALLHDVIEDTSTTIDYIKEKFGEETAHLVDGVTKISSLKKQSRSTEQIQSLRKMLLATTNDPRVIIIKLADKLHNMKTIEFLPYNRQRSISREVLDIYAPIAQRLGMSKISSELEDLAFKILYPDKYDEITSSVVQKKQEIEDYISNIENILRVKLNELSINAEIKGRAKHFFSIFRKMELKKKSFDDIFDIRAIRIITDSIEDCYSILGIVHTLWSPIIPRFKDYIAVPKSNMYQSIHTTVIGPDGHPLEIQIRTKRMNTTSEFGIASHWLYKEKTDNPSRVYKTITLFKNLQKESIDEDDPREFMKQLKMELYEDEIFTFTPKGKIIKLAKGSTSLDFAYAIHTEVGNQCVGAKVNNTIAPLKHELKSGDIVEILTNKKGHPSESWLKIVKSSNARYKIRNWLRRQHETSDKSQSERPSKKKDKKVEVKIPENELGKISSISRQNKQILSINGTTNILLKLSQCCQPIPGDEVVGFITRGRGLTVHKKNCASLKRLNVEKERFINIVWDSSEFTYPVKIAVHAIDRPNLLRDMADEIAAAKTNIIKMEGHMNEKDNVIFNLVIEVKSIKHLNEIISKLKTIKNITNIIKIK